MATRPRTPRAFSLRSKLGALGVGDLIYLPDWDAGPGPTSMERQVQSAIHRAPELVGRKFITRRADVLVGREHHYALMVERTE